MIPLDCLCANTRRAARLVTQVYSREMGPAVEPSQFVLLSVLARKPGLPQVALGAALGYDKTTLSRSLLLLRKNGWITLASSEDARERGYRLTRSGAELLKTTKPRWQRSQRLMRGAMTAEEWVTVGRALEIIGRVASELSLGGV